MSSPVTLPVFDAAQQERARTYLATQVVEMMGRKFEEGDWAKVYAAAKNMPLGTWSNLDIDASYGALGVEQKMICRPAHKSILDACGTSIMHPAGTRAIRIPSENDPTRAAREVLRQYGELIDERTAIVRITNEYNHGAISRGEAIHRLGAEARMNPGTAAKALPAVLNPVGEAGVEIDMRMGWLLWASDLSEFLYFEERMTKPDPLDFVAEWKSSGGGRRRTSRNLWVYNIKTGEKLYSITTEAGAKIQPYFTVPTPLDDNLYHFKIRGDEAEEGLIRVWLTKSTADVLERMAGGLSPDNISRFISRCKIENYTNESKDKIFDPPAVSILVEAEFYMQMNRVMDSVSDEHLFRILIDYAKASKKG